MWLEQLSGTMILKWKPCIQNNKVDEAGYPDTWRFPVISELPKRKKNKKQTNKKNQLFYLIQFFLRF
jgi:hypothetical protein